jgi:hypothetical protein
MEWSRDAAPTPVRLLDAPRTARETPSASEERGPQDDKPVTRAIPSRAVYTVNMPVDSHKTFYLETFGCQMNVHDSEKVIGTLVHEGYRQVETVEQADLILYNTCSIRDKAEQKVFHRLADYKKLLAQGKRFGVLGCVAQQEGEKIFERAPHVSLVCGSASYRKLPQMLAQLEVASPAGKSEARKPEPGSLVRITGLDDRETHGADESASRIHHDHRRLRQVLCLLCGAVYAGQRAQPHFGVSARRSPPDG